MKIFFLFLSYFVFSTLSAQKIDLLEEHVFTIVEDMPIYEGCEVVKDKLMRLECSQEKLYLFFKSEAKKVDNKNRGVIYISFIIDENGKARSAKVVKGVKNAPELDGFGIDMVNALPRYTPGKQRGVPVKLQYTVPVKFK